MYRYKRLLFGLNAAFELFQQQISNLFRDEEGITNISDDILVFGKTPLEHNQNLRKCFSILKENGLTLSKDKCQFMKSEIEYYGFLISGEGIRPTESKIEAIKSFRIPTNAKEVRSFLGLINYLGRFTPNLATLTAPLRRLTTAGYLWRWTKEESDCFNQLKDLLASTKTMAHFKTGIPIKLVVDASPVGLGAILMQDQGDGNYKPVSYASRSLSDVEQRYSQTEREALSVVWACEKYHLYVHGKQITIETDHKPLIGLLGPGGNRSARINKFALKLLQYDFNLEYLPGKYNPADVLSRCPIKHKHQATNWSYGYELEVEQHINQVIANSIPKTLTLSQIREASIEDAEINRIIEALRNNDKWSNYPELAPFRKVSAELTHKGGIVLKNNLIVVPKHLRQTVLNIVHAHHLGINKTKALLRGKVWWPTIGSEVENLVKTCVACTVVQPAHKPEPLTMTKMPPAWTKLNMDLCGPMPDGWSIIGIIDAGTRWPEIFITKSTTTSVITRKMTELFVNKGRPIEIVTDNGPQFASVEFRQYCRQWGIKHHPVTPYYPQANSEIERFFRTAMKAIKIAVIEGKDWKEEIKRFLMYYRNTPHATTGKSPAELMYGRQLRDQLPTMEPAPTRAYKEAMTTDARNKAKIKSYADPKLKKSLIEVGDMVVVKQRKKNKFSTNFGLKRYRVTKRNKATLTLSHPVSRTLGKDIKRHTSAVRKLVLPYKTGTSRARELNWDETSDIDNPTKPPLVPETHPSAPARPPVPIVWDGNIDSSSSDSEDDRHTQQSLPQPAIVLSSDDDVSEQFVRRSSRPQAGGGVHRFAAE